MDKVILNVDTGVDDALAMVLLKKYRINPKFIVAASGNSILENTYRNTKGVSDLLGFDCPVYPGSYRPLVKPHFYEDFHGKNGMACYKFDDAPWKNLPNGIIKMYEALKRDRYTIVCTSPMTSLAILLSIDPDIKDNIENLIIMGGAFGITPYGKGNIGDSEFNIFYDPEAAKIVLGSDINETIIPLDLTMNPELAIKHLPTKAANTPLEEFIWETTEFMLKTHGIFELHDPIAAFSLINQDAFKFLNGDIEVDRDGVTAFKGNKNSRKRIATGINMEIYKKALVKTIYR
jgi:inosine-uridine nucleoside N-ribohydrolase